MRNGYWLAFVLCAAAATGPLLVTPILPAVDLPEHMAQVTIWKHLGDPCHAFGDVFALNLATPYLLGYVLMRALASVMTVSAAAKLTVWLSIVLLPLSVRALLRRADADPWLSLVGFLLAYGYVFYWGFLNFALAMPIGLFYVALLQDEQRSVWKRVAVALLLLSAHALMFIFCAIVTLAAAAVRRAPKLLVPLLAPAGLFSVFVVRLRDTEPAARGRLTWWKGPHERLAEFPSLLFANGWEPFGLLLLFGLIVAVLSQWPRMTREPARWVLFTCAAVTYLFAPLWAYGSTYVYPRFAFAVAAGALFLLEQPRRRPRVSRAIVIVLVLMWMVVVTSRFQRFGVGVREYERLLDQLPPNRRVVQFNVVPGSNHVPGPVYWHFGALYQVRRGGLTAWSFANFYPQIVRYRPGAEPRLKSHSTPLDGMDWPGILQYDYLLVRGPDPRRWLFRDAPVAIALDRHVGDWWVFATPRSLTPQRACPPLNE